MQEIVIGRIDQKHEADICLANQPFELFGKLVPLFDGKNWSYTEEIFPEKSSMCFPDENDQMADMTDCIFLGAYLDEQCVGLAVLQKSWNKYLYVYDLKVNADLRGKGVGGRLMDGAEDIARELGYRGLWVVAQDNNLAACRFYLKQGFVIGGLDTHVYNGTSQQGKADIHFYRENRAAT